ncbi:hypothetical protein HBB16_04775 [Pseudonocardia sp. MCCB 268]|nr:hypothetical protein [Pseudonocardia cytotoxica]
MLAAEPAVRSDAGSPRSRCATSSPRPGSASVRDQYHFGRGRISSPPSSSTGWARSTNDGSGTWRCRCARCCRFRYDRLFNAQQYVTADPRTLVRHWSGHWWRRSANPAATTRASSPSQSLPELPGLRRQIASSLRAVREGPRQTGPSARRRLCGTVADGHPPVHHTIADHEGRLHPPRTEWAAG